jgi:hypothetical protein
LNDQATRDRLIANDFSPFVVQLLLARVAADLRSAEVLCTWTYVAQVATVVSSMFEAAYAVGFVGSDAAKAAAWMMHDNPRKTYPSSLKKAVAASLELLNIPGGQAIDGALSTYGWLCQAKHANLKFQHTHGAVFDSLEIAAYRIEPEADSDTVVWGRMVLNQAVAVGIRATMLGYLAHFDREVSRSIAPRINPLVERMMELSERMTADLPRGDLPAPGTPNNG